MFSDILCFSDTMASSLNTLDTASALLLAQMDLSRFDIVGGGSDFVLKCQGKSIKAHSFILRMRYIAQL